MAERATIQSVQDYLVKEDGWSIEYTQRFMHDHADVVSDGIRMGSFTYYVAGELLRLHMREGA